MCICGHLTHYFFGYPLARLTPIAFFCRQGSAGGLGKSKFPTKPWMAQQVLRCQQYFLTTLVMLFDGKDIGVSKNLGATNSQTLGFNQQKLQVTCFILI